MSERSGEQPGDADASSTVGADRPVGAGQSSVGGDRRAGAEQVRALVEPVLDARGLDLYDVELAGATLRVLVDRSGGVDLDTLGEVTRAVSAVLDDTDLLPPRSTLEVSSPGLERPLRTPRHFAGAVGAEVRVKTQPGTEGDRRADGVLVAADGEGVTVEVDGIPRRLAYGEIERARTVFTWGPAPKPGSPGKPASRKGAPSRKATRP